MCPVYRTVIHINHDFLSQQLLVVIPQYRVIIHGQAAILGGKDQRIAYPLHIRAIHTYLMIRPRFPEHRISIQIVGIHLQCIGMHKQAVTL